MTNEAPDKNCYTLPNGDCIGVGCMHNQRNISPIIGSSDLVRRTVTTEVDETFLPGSAAEALWNIGRGARAADFRVWKALWGDPALRRRILAIQREAVDAFILDELAVFRRLVESIRWMPIASEDDDEPSEFAVADPDVYREAVELIEQRDKGK